MYWKWAYYINPVAFAIQSVVAPQFQHRDGCSVYDPQQAKARARPSSRSGAPTSSRSTSLLYVEDKYDVTYAGRWLPAVWLVIFCIGVQMLHIAAAKFVNTVNR